MKIYTRTGDAGTTGLIGGSRVAKSDLRLECYGTVDELNATLGLAAAAVEDGVRRLLGPVQEALFLIGSHLAAPAGDAKAAKHLPPLEPGMSDPLEAQIDAAEAELAPLSSFVLPGGTEAAARLHVARTVCRRAERRLVEFSGIEPVAPEILRYLNRLSDWLFVHARLANHRAGVADIPWVPKT